jgi:hypothetical protein
MKIQVGEIEKPETNLEVKMTLNHLAPQQCFEVFFRPILSCLPPRYAVQRLCYKEEADR